jgi:hypothetical protein
VASNVIEFPSHPDSQAAPPGAVRLTVPVHYHHYARLARAARLFDTTVSDVLERVLAHEFDDDEPVNSRHP